MRYEQIFRIHDACNPEPINCQYFSTKPVAMIRAKRRAQRNQTNVFVDKRAVVDGKIIWTLVHLEEVTFKNVRGRL